MTPFTFSATCGMIQLCHGRGLASRALRMALSSGCKQSALVNPIDPSLGRCVTTSTVGPVEFAPAQRPTEGLICFTNEAGRRGSEPSTGDPKQGGSISMSKRSIVAPSADSGKQLTLVPHMATYQPDVKTSIDLRLEKDTHTVWATQRQIADVLDITVQGVSQQIQNFKKDRGDKAKAHINSWFIVASDGKNREVEHYDQTVLAYVGFRAKATERVIAFQDWVGSVLGKHIHAQYVRRKELDLLEKAGYGETEGTQHLRERIAGIEALDKLKATVAAICKDANYGALFGAEYKALFCKMAWEIKQLLDTKNIRESLPTLQLSFLRTAELSVQAVIKSFDAATSEDIEKVIRRIVTPLGEALQQVADMRGVNPITGKTETK